MRILFVVTTQENMGDLALCQEWIGDLGRDEHRFAFVITENHGPFIDPRDERYAFSSEVDVADTVVDAARRFRADAIVMASNSFWSIRGQRGAAFGRFPEKLFDLGVPLLSFDPFEIGFRTYVSHADQAIEFPAIPDGVWKLRYMSRASDDAMARHFCTRAVYDAARDADRAAILRRYGADPARKAVVFPVSANRFKAITRSFRRYYLHLARLFSMPPLRDAQFLVVTPHRVPGLQHAPNVIHVPHLQFGDFLRLLAACDLYLTDSLISCMVSALHLARPVALLANSERSAHLARGTFLDGPRFFPFKVFPYGFTEVCDALVDRFEIGGCFVEAEVLDPAHVVETIGGVLFEEQQYARIAARCMSWKEARLTLPSPKQTLESVLAATGTRA